MTRRERRALRYWIKPAHNPLQWVLWVMFLIMALAPLARAEICTSYCTPGVSKACGGGCISEWKNCHKPTTTACNGLRPKSKATNIFASPKHVDPVATTSEPTK